MTLRDTLPDDALQDRHEFRAILSLEFLRRPDEGDDAGFFEESARHAIGPPTAEFVDDREHMLFAVRPAQRGEETATIRRFVAGENLGVLEEALKPLVVCGF